MKILRNIISSVFSISLLLGLSACGVKQSSLSTQTQQSTSNNSKQQQTQTHQKNITPSQSQKKNTVSGTAPSQETSHSNTNDNTATKKPTQTITQEHSFGWRYVKIPTSFGTSSQIAGISMQNKKIQLRILSEKISSKQVQNQYSMGAYQLDTNQLSNPQKSAEAPTGYQGSWKLSFGQMNGHKPVPMTLTREGTSILLPSSIPAYASEINPAPGDPGKFDNKLLGQSGNWIWIAMKGPGDPPMPGLVWGYRQWNRILAVNTQTQKTQVFPIPKRTSETDIWGTTPGFEVINDKVYIATGNWVGLFPADPTNRSSVPIVVPEPKSKVAADQTAMLKTLNDLETQAATGITSFWNNYVMKGDQKVMNNSWIGDPATFNHGDYPHDLYWALNFPLKKGTHAYKQRAMLVQNIEQLLKSPLMRVWIVYPDPASMKSHFHSTPPTTIPGYHIVNGYYVKNKS